MAFKLTRKQELERNSLHTQLLLAQERVEDAVVKGEEAVAAAMDSINAEIAAYNDVLRMVQEFVFDTAAAWQDASDLKSEEWQDSEQGVAVGDLIREWENADFEEIDDIPLPVSLFDEVSDLSHADVLMDLPDSTT